MTVPTSSSADEADKTKLPPKALLIWVLAIAIVITGFWVFKINQKDPYIRDTLNLQGDTEKGSQLFRMNCVGCHGISAQGLVGPNLQGVSSKRNDAELIHQVISGKTPPMPKYKLDPQSMADLLEYMHSLS
ncbi:cytochrome c [Prochlorococcus sp. MIT 1300]|uniref:cytochrome c n=1 Tax=Prochlorococcus sp. MIT 1300 TaxID=3096218 RepID=UPI002A75174B|nr:cytochrome c [Prochlorococcus sp. MIT 1300]